MNQSIKKILDRGVVIPASPLALDENRQHDPRRQKAIYRYYSAAGAGGIAVGVHTTQFEIRDPAVGLFEPVLRLAADEMDSLDATREEPLIRIGGICGQTEQATDEAKLLVDLGYHAGLLSLAAYAQADEQTMLKHCKTIAQIVPIIGFYLQSSVGGRVLPYSFWRRFVEIENVTAIKIAPFNRYQTLDVVRAVAESGREDIAIYTGNDDNIVLDLLCPYRFEVKGQIVERCIIGGLLGHWSVWTRRAVELLETCHECVKMGGVPSRELLSSAAEVTDSNAAFFDAANRFAGCIAGLHEVLHRQGLLENIYCLNPNETLSPGQKEEIDRVYQAYPHLNDDAFVAEHLREWLA